MDNKEKLQYLETLLTSVQDSEKKTYDKTKANPLNKDWKILFDFYNGNHERKLSMNCRPCFGKVYAFIIFAIVQIKKVLDEPSNQTTSLPENT